jgi:lysophospholipase L1-like esterase
MTETEVDLAACLRGAPWAGNDVVPYPRADPDDFDRLPIDTWAMAAVPAGVRLELICDGTVDALLIDYETTTDDPGYRGAGAGLTFTAWSRTDLLSEAPANLGRDTVELDLSGVEGRVTVHLPEGMRPKLAGIRSQGGVARPAPSEPVWLCYGDSIAEGWTATGPARSWPMIVSRALDLDVSNLGYAGAARGETVSALHVASLPADVISLSHGTNCWNRTPHSADQVGADYAAFLDTVRATQPETPIIALSPVIRPDAENTANLLGATLGELRSAIETKVTQRMKSDPNLALVPGGAVIEAADLVDGVHPGNVGHVKIAAAVRPALAEALSA